MSVHLWSTTAGDNGSSDPSVNFREGQAPSTINNACRALMAGVKKWYTAIGGMIDTGGSSTAYTITSGMGLAALTDGFHVSARMHTTNGAAPTLAVDGLTAKLITTAPGTPADAGMLLVGSVHTFVFDSSNEEWRLKGIFVPPGTAKTGDRKTKYTSTVDPGWLLADGATIGNASSGGTSRADADCQALFLQLHQDYPNSILPIQDSSGSPSTRATGGTPAENAAADWAANKRLPLPRENGRVFAALDNMGGISANLVAASSADTLGGTVGAETVTIDQANLPNVDLPSSNLTVSLTNNTLVLRSTQFGQGQAGTGFQARVAGLDSTLTPSISGTVPLGGSGTALNKMQPTLFGYVFIKL